MSATTTLKLPDSLKVRIANLAENAGKTPHAFMVEALEIETHRRELRRDFVGSALLAEQEVLQGGEVYSMDAVHRFLNDKLAGSPARKPKATKLTEIKRSSSRSTTAIRTSKNKR